MLVLTRKPGEELWIGDSIRVLVVEIRPVAVRIAIEAPRDIPIVRSELAADQPVTHDGGPDRCDGAPSDGALE